MILVFFLNTKLATLIRQPRANRVQCGHGIPKVIFSRKSHHKFHQKFFNRAGTEDNMAARI